MSEKQKIPDDVKQICIQVARGYNRRVRNYYNRRREIIEGSACGYVVIPDSANPEDWTKTMWAYTMPAHNAQRTAENKAEQLLGLEKLPDVLRMRAVERAQANVRQDLPQELRQKLVKAIMLNCKSGRRFPYKVLDVEGFSERGFYRERDGFLCDIAKFLGLL